MDVLLVLAVAPTLTGMGTWLLLRRGVSWRRVALVPALAVLLAGMSTDWLRGELDPLQVPFWLGLAVGVYGCWLLSWRIVQPVFQRLFGTRW